MPEIIALPLFVALLASLLFSLVFLFRIVGAMFSSQLRREIRSKPFVHFMMFCAIPISVGLVVLIHPTWLKRYEERKTALERVKQAGGWDAIKRDCLLIANRWTNNEEYISFLKNNTVSLPPAIAALKPYRVRCYNEASRWPVNTPQRSTACSTPIVQIHVTGLKSTDNSWPRYNFWVVCGESPENYVSKIAGVHVRQITDSVFEVVYY